MAVKQKLGVRVVDGTRDFFELKESDQVQPSGSRVSNGTTGVAVSTGSNSDSCDGQPKEVQDLTNLIRQTVENEAKKLKVAARTNAPTSPGEAQNDNDNDHGNGNANDNDNDSDSASGEESEKESTKINEKQSLCECEDEDEDEHMNENESDNGITNDGHGQLHGKSSRRECVEYRQMRASLKRGMMPPSATSTSISSSSSSSADSDSSSSTSSSISQAPPRKRKRLN